MSWRASCCQLRTSRSAGGRIHCSNNIVPNGALSTLEMRPFQLAKMQKVRYFNIDFLNIFGGIAPHPATGEGLRHPSSYPTPLGAPAFRACRASLGTYGPSVARKRDSKRTSCTLDFLGPAWVTSSITWPLDAQCTHSCWWSSETIALSRREIMCQALSQAYSHWKCFDPIFVFWEQNRGV